MSFSWLRNGSGWAKLVIAIAFFSIGYLVQIKVDSQRIKTLEEWRLEHNGMVTGPQEERIRRAESDISALIRMQEFLAGKLTSIETSINNLHRDISDKYKANP